jgi:hypothetical protein
MRQSLIILAIAGATLSPVSFAQSVQVPKTTMPSSDDSPASRDSAPVSKAHQAMASFNSLLREAALQSQAKQRSARTTHVVAPSSSSPAQAVQNGRDAMAATPDPIAVH